MQKEDQIIIYLKQLTDTVGIINQKVDALDQKIDSVEENLNRRIDEVEAALNRRIDKLESRIDELESRIDRLESRIDKLESRIDELGSRIDRLESRIGKLESRIDELGSRIDEIELRLEEVKSYLDDKIDLIEKALDTEIDKVYQIAHKNEYNIEMLLIPYNERNLHVNDELAKMARYGERMDEMEAVLESHSEAIHRLQNNMQCPAIAPGM